MKIANSLNKIKIIFALFGAVLALESCNNIGLGEEVDLSAPVLEITSHSDNDTVPAEFTLKGTAYDNDEISSITIDFENQNLHYKVVPGNVWYKKATGSNDEWISLSDSEGSCVKNNSVWNWSVCVKTSDGNSSETSYILSAVATDRMGNSGKTSKVDLSLIVDEENPNVSIYIPDLLTGSYDEVSKKVSSYSLRDGSIISNLLNGDISFSGRQDGSIGYKELKIEFDSGKLSSGMRKITGNSELYESVEDISKNVKFDEDDVTVYYSKILKAGEDGVGDLRSWNLTVPQDEWVSADKNSELLKLSEEAGSGKVIRVVTTSLSDSYAWEKKVIGYFVWWPEADTPWIEATVGDDNYDKNNLSEVYPSANFAGTVQDDDGIESVFYKIEKMENDKWSEYVGNSSINLSDKGTKYSAFAIRVPSENGVYSISVTVTDIYGISATKKKYFKILDVTPPSINLSEPENNSSVLADSAGNIAFSGTVSDDGSVKSLSIIYLNPMANEHPDNIVRYMGGREKDWDKATESGEDSDEYSYSKDGKTVKYKNKIYKIELGSGSYDEKQKITKYNFTKTFNIFKDLGIDGKEKLLSTQYFVLRAQDNGKTNTVVQYTLVGDNESPSLEITSIQQFGSDGTPKIGEFAFTENSVPNLAAVKDGDYVILKGTWSDNSVKAWNNDKSRLSASSIAFDWGDANFAITSQTLNVDGSWNWEAKVTNIPKSSKSISASLTDLGGNKKSVIKSIFVETSELGLESIGSETADGSYNSGKKIEIALNFTKNTKVDTSKGTPELLLNNGGKAVYKSGSGTSQHIFEYTISESDKDTALLNVTKFVSNGAVYTDASVTGGKEFEVELPTESEKTLAGSKRIKIDNAAPKISSLKAISNSGYYNAGKTILLLLSFDENVTISDVTKLGFEFNSISSPTISASESGSNVIFQYVVKAGENVSSLSIKSIKHDGVTVTDEAGNVLADWTISSGLGKNICIDTTAPSAPTINKNWGDKSVVTAQTSFTISGTETGAKVEYSIDGGTNWLTYKAVVSLSNNGTYKIRARQTDKAGNVSGIADGGTVTIEKGDFLDKITADTTSGTYSVSKGGSVNGRIIFRKDVTLPTDATVTLNVKRKSNSSSVVEPLKTTLTKATSATISGGADYTFTYTIQDGDFIDGNAKLDVTGWSFTNATYGGTNIDLSYSSVVTSGNRFSDNRSIYVLTGKPAPSAALGGTVNSDGTVSSPKLTVTFDRNISKVGGIITLSLDGDSNSDKFIAPAVISESKYDSAFDEYYTQGQNGATKGSDNKLTNDTTTKYVLNFATEPTDTTLVNLFVKNGWNKVEIPVVSSAVTVSGKVLTVDLSSTYKLPVMGAKYKLTIPAGAVTDEAQNSNAQNISSVTALGVEPPVIRINKGKQTIKGTAENSSVTMPDTAQMRIDCQTPGATIYYGKTENETTNYQVIKSNFCYDTKSNAESTIPTVSGTESEKYTVTTPLTLGASVSSYGNATGLKVAIAAYAQKNSANSAYAYEYATRTVLKLNLNGNGYSADNAIKNQFSKRRVWVVGGDSAYGGNSIDTFPLEWHNSKKFKLMKSDSGWDSEYKAKWYWISWDITTATYHGFILGDVPSDAAENGPSDWYSAQGAWDAQKTNYVLYPGETLEMTIGDGSNYTNGGYYWREKNYGKRS